jgi:hypothetical protein
MFKNIANGFRSDFEFQVIFSFALGLLLAPFSWGLIFTILYVIFYEVYVILVTASYPPSIKMMDRVVINLFFIFGWVISRIIYCDESGFEPCFDYFFK